MTFSALLGERLTTLETSYAALARRLTAKGIETSRESVRQWAIGESRPAPWKWTTVLDVLGVQEVDRAAWRTALEQHGTPNARRSPAAVDESHRSPNVDSITSAAGTIDGDGLPA